MHRVSGYVSSLEQVEFPLLSRHCISSRAQRNMCHKLQIAIATEQIAEELRDTRENTNVLTGLLVVRHLGRYIMC